MILLFICIVIVTILFSKIQLKFYLNNKDFKGIIILFKVIKININAKAIKSRGEDVYKYSDIIKGNIRNLINLIEDSSKSLKYILSKINLCINVDSSYYILSPDKTAICFGLINIIIYNLENILLLVLKEYRGNYNIKPDFQEKKNIIKIDGSISVRIIHILIFVIKLIPLILKYWKLIKNKGGDINESSYRRTNENYHG
jgi:hypothetical protein